VLYVPAGQVGLWCSDNSDNDFDDFKVQDIAGPFEVDGRWFSNTGDLRVDSSDNNVLETYGSCDGWRTIVRRGFRADKYVATYKFKWSTPCKPGFLVRWLDPGNSLRIQVRSTDGKAQLARRKDDGNISALATSASALSLPALDSPPRAKPAGPSAAVSAAWKAACQGSSTRGTLPRWWWTTTGRTPPSSGCACGWTRAES
jgi:hypothetical protein